MKQKQKRCYLCDAIVPRHSGSAGLTVLRYADIDLGFRDFDSLMRRIGLEGGTREEINRRVKERETTPERFHDIGSPLVCFKCACDAYLNEAAKGLEP